MEFHILVTKSYFLTIRPLCKHRIPSLVRKYHVHSFLSEDSVHHLPRLVMDAP